jgi:hypothetical protein
VFKELIYRVIGQPPVAASRGEQLRWIRRFYVFSFAGVIAIVVLAIATGSTFLWIAAAAAAIWSVLGFGLISARIRREEARDV